MNKSYQSDATKMLNQFDAAHLSHSKAQLAEIQKHHQIFNRPKNPSHSWQEEFLI